MRRSVSTALVVLCVGGCSFLVDTSDRAQCSVDADCAANAALAGRVCRGGFCALAPAPASNDGGEACTSTALCTQSHGTKSVCRQAGKPCVDLLVDGCIELTEGWDDPNAIIVGSLLPLTLVQPNGKAADVKYSMRVLRGIDVAAEELRDALPAGYLIGGAQRPVSVLHCDSRGDKATATKMLTHLVDVAGAKVVIVGWDEDLEAIAADVKTKQIPIVCSDCLVPGHDTKPWKILPPITSDVPLVRWHIGQIETAKAAAIKVAVLSEDFGPQSRFYTELASTLTFNGKSAAANGPTFFQSEIAPDSRFQFPAYDAIAQRIATFEPDVVVVAMASDFPRSYLPLIEEKWPAGKPRPRYVLTQISYDAPIFDAQLPATAAGDDLRKRIAGTHPYTTPERAANIARYEIAYRKEWKEPGSGSFSGYEAFYATALSIATASGKPALDAAVFDAGFAKLVSGTTFDVSDVGTFTNTLGLLGQGGSFDVRGLYTDLDWDASREVPSDMGMFCFERPAGGELTLHDIDVRWSAATGQITGTFACP
jgi:hypothetical protein